jgi:outer membrane receptor for ferrienterochelin and colicins
VTVRWRTAALDARAAWRPSDRLRITPQVVLRWEQPWRTTATDLPDLYYDVTNQRATGRLVAEWDPIAAASVVAGAEAYVEQGRVNEFSNGLLSYGAAGRRSVTDRNAAAFLELGADTPLANVLAGARLERHSVFGTSFVPRFALTRLFAPFHLKLLASGAFRTPSIENVNYGEGVRPERTWAFEAEGGWQISDAVYLAANVFDLTVERPIVFGYAGTDVYTNERRTGSRGVETTLEVRRGIVSTSVSWSYYSARGKNRVDAYAVAGHPDLLVGFAGHKIAATAQIRPFRALVVSPSVVFLSDRFGYDRVDAAGALALGRLGAQTTLDLFAAWADLGTPGLEVGLGVRDLLDEGNVLVQPYPGGHAPLAGGGREVMLRVRYERVGR